MGDMRVVLPGSKSVAARALVLDQVFGLGLRFGNLPDCDDTLELQRALTGFPSADEYDLGTGGTSLRFFLALAASTPGFSGVLDCSEALRRRPLRQLVDALRMAGADISCLKKEGEAPLLVKGGGLDGRGVVVDSSVSSQFVSALMMVSPLWEHPFELKGEVGVSQPYVGMTQVMIRSFRELLPGTEYEIEPDWSAASYFYEYALLNPGREVRIERLVRPERSLQGDSACAAIFGSLGVRTEFCDDGSASLYCGGIARDEVQFDMRETPDMVPALAVGMCLAGVRFRITGVSHLRHKESDRLATLRQELAKLGYCVRTDGDSISWEGLRCGMGASLDSHGDHRIAMSLAVAVAGLEAEVPERFGRTLKIAGFDCVSKSFPTFREALSKLNR